MSIRLAIRLFADGEQILEERVDADESELAGLAEKHTVMLGDLAGPHMIEIEFLDEPDPNQRFFRFGTDPRGMVIPIAIDLK